MTRLETGNGNGDGDADADDDNDGELKLELNVLGVGVHNQEESTMFPHSFELQNINDALIAAIALKFFFYAFPN